jgi:hypothetical protein
MTYAPFGTKAPFLNRSEVFPEDDTQFLIKLTNLYSDIANAVNLRQIGQYQQGVQTSTGQQFSVANDNTTKTFAFRQVYYFGQILQGATLNIPTNIVGMTQLTHVYGTCATGTDFRPLPYVSNSLITDQVLVIVRYIGAVQNIIIVNGATHPDIDSGMIVLEYLLN